MTKLRTPTSFENALDQISVVLPDGWTEMAQVCDRGVSTVRAWANPDMRDSIPASCMLSLEIAYRKAGGIGTPLRDAYDAQFDAACTHEFADQIELGHATLHVIKEAGDASTALFRATLPGADEKALIDADRETGEGIVALTRASAIVKRLLKLRRFNNRPVQPP